MIVEGWVLAVWMRCGQVSKHMVGNGLQSVRYAWAAMNVSEVWRSAFALRCKIFGRAQRWLALKKFSARAACALCSAGRFARTLRRKLAWRTKRTANGYDYSTWSLRVGRRKLHSWNIKTGLLHEGLYGFQVQIKKFQRVIAYTSQTNTRHEINLCISVILLL